MTGTYYVRPPIDILADQQRSLPFLELFGSKNSIRHFNSFRQHRSYHGCRKDDLPVIQTGNYGAASSIPGPGAQELVHPVLVNGGCTASIGY
jgi:hypothetical protein